MNFKGSANFEKSAKSRVHSEATIFHKILSKEIPATIVFEDEHCLAFRDIQPQAPQHILLIPKEFVEKLDALQQKPEDQALLGHLMSVIPQIARKQKFTEYRIVINNGSKAGQTVFYLHIHILAGRAFQWPPG